MAASKLIPPAQWPGMTFLEILQMIYLANTERVAVCSMDRFSFFRSAAKTDYLIKLKNICWNFRNMLNVFPGTFGGFLNPSFDPMAQPFPPTYTPTDMRWTMTDMLADIGATEFYDFSQNNYTGAPSPIENMSKDYLVKEYLQQYYDMLIRMNQPVIEWQLAKDKFVFGLWDEGVQTKANAAGERGPGSNSGLSSRKLILKMEGQSVGYGAPFNDPYAWPGDQADHDADYGLIYQFPPNTGSSRPGGTGTVLELYPQNSIITSSDTYFRAAGVGPFALPKDEQFAEYILTRTSLNYQNFAGGTLSAIPGKPRDVYWWAYTTDESDGDLGNPYLKDQLFKVTQNFTGNSADDILHGEFPGRGGPPDIPKDESQGFSYRLPWLAITEDWNYEGGYEYYT